MTRYPFLLAQPKQQTGKQTAYSDYLRSLFFF